MKGALIAFCAALSAGCGSGLYHPLKKAELKKTLAEGRRVNIPNQTNEATSLALSSGLETRAFYAEQQGSESPLVLQFDTRQSPKLARQEVAAFANAWLAQHAFELGLSDGEWTPSATPIVELRDDLLVLNFDRYFQGILVRDAHIQISFALNEGVWRLREVLNRSHGSIALSNAAATRLLDDDLVASLAPLGLSVLSSREVIYPTLSANSNLEMVRATEVKTIDNDDDSLRSTITLKNDTGELLEAFAHRYAAQVQVEGKVYDRTYLMPTPVARPLPLTTVQGAGMNTDADGYYEANIADQSSVNVSLVSSRAVARSSGTTTPYLLTGTYDEAMNKVTLATNDAQFIGLNAYLSVHRINAFSRRHLKSSEAAILDRNITINTNVAGSCNAFYDGNLSLFAAGDGCSNMALVNDITYHEWGHGLDDTVGRASGVTDGAFSEGIGDILSGYYTNSPIMGPGFDQGISAGIRTLQNNKRYPDDRGEVHAEGEIIGGAFWDLRQALISRYGATRGAYMAERLFLRHLLVSDSYLESYQNVLTLDDDDGNAMTPSPNLCLINAAFARHGLATALADCQDQPAAVLAVKTEGSLALTVLTNSETGASLAAAAPLSARQVYACVGSELECLNAKRQDVTFKLDGQKGEKILFVATSPLPLAEQQQLTIFAHDKDGALLGKRSYALHSK